MVCPACCGRALKHARMLPSARAQFLSDWSAKLWSRFFCLSVYVTMYLNDHQRSAFYESLGLDTTQFNRCARAHACARCCCVHACEESSCRAACSLALHVCSGPGTHQLLDLRHEKFRPLALTWAQRNE